MDKNKAQAVQQTSLIDALNIISKRLFGLTPPWYWCGSEWSRSEMVVEKMAERGYWLQIKSPFCPGGEWSAGFTPHNTTGWNGVPDHLAFGWTFPEAVARSALRYILETMEREGDDGQ